MTDDKIIEEILTLLNTQGETPIDGFLFSKGITDRRIVWEYINHLKELNLGEQLEEDSTFMRPTRNGQNIYNAKGWENHLEKEKEDFYLKKQVTNLTVEKLEYEKTIRGLEEQLKKVNLHKSYWQLATIIISLGMLIGGIIYQLR